jgi:hypothetical protein
MKEKKCRTCKEPFKPQRSLQNVCSLPCAIVYSKRLVKKEQKQAEKAKRREIRQRKEKLKTRSDWLRLAENEFRRFIRARDRLFYLRQGKQPECISCGTTNPSIQYAAGHFKTKGAYPELRLDELNCHLQCNKNCNSALSGNIGGTKTTHGYRKGIILRYGNARGQEILDYLDGPHPIANWTVDEIKEMKKDFSRRARDLEAQVQNYL